MWLRLRSEVRHRWRAWVGLAVLVGFAGGTAMALAQAARRSQHAYVRFSDRQRAADVVMTGRSSFGLVGSVDLAAVARTGYVAANAPAFVGLPFSGRTDTGEALDAVDVFPVASGDDQLGTTVERWKMLAGRRARASHPEEATASFVLAERLGLHVGSRLDLRFYRADRFASVAVNLLASLGPRIAGRDRPGQATPDFADGPRVQFTVVGIEASPVEFPPLLTDLAPVLHLTPAFAQRYQDQIVGSPLSYFRLRPGRTLKAFELAVERMAGGQPVSFVSTRANQSAKVQRSIRAEALALAIVAGLVGLTGAVTIGQAMTRQTLNEMGQLPVLRALGMRDGQVRAVALARALVIAVSGAVLAALLAVFGSQYVLLPLAQKAELDAGSAPRPRGIDLRGRGGVAPCGRHRAVVGACRDAPEPVVERRARAVARTLPERNCRRRPARRVAALGDARRAVRVAASVACVAGVGDDRATALTVALLAGALTVTANLNRVLDDAHRYGWNWDVKVGAPGLPDYSAFVLPTLRSDAQVTALSAGTVTQIDAGRARIDVLAVDRIKGRALPTMLAGRARWLPERSRSAGAACACSMPVSETRSTCASGRDRLACGSSDRRCFPSSATPASSGPARS